jgi:hypothetical protein
MARTFSSGQVSRFSVCEANSVRFWMFTRQYFSSSAACLRSASKVP